MRYQIPLEVLKCVKLQGTQVPIFSGTLNLALLFRLGGILTNNEQRQGPLLE